MNVKSFLYATLTLLPFIPQHSAHASTFKTLWQFSGSDGADPFAGLTIDGKGNLYGVTPTGGDEGNGVIFSLPLSTGKLKVLYPFKGGSDGGQPRATLFFDTKGYLNGTTFFGGNSNGYGVVFHIKTNGKSFATLHAFNGTDGSYPSGRVTEGASGVIYGTTFNGGNNAGFGTVFELIPKSRKLTTLYTFNYNDSGVFPDGALPVGGPAVDSSGNIYGTTEAGGSMSSDMGTLFMLSPKKKISILHNFTNGSDGGMPVGNLVIQNSTLFGTTETGGQSGLGTVFSYDLSSGTFTTLCSFKGGTDGASPYAGVTVGPSGVLYGTAYAGGSSGNGTVFKYDPTTKKCTGIYQFTGGNDGEKPEGDLAIDSAGTLYGTTSMGGKNFDGTVFELTP